MGLAYIHHRSKRLSNGHCVSSDCCVGCVRFDGALQRKTVGLLKRDNQMWRVVLDVTGPWDTIDVITLGVCLSLVVVFTLYDAMRSPH